jgi:hypothetical protein
MGKSICTANIATITVSTTYRLPCYCPSCDNDDNNGGRSICGANSHCDNNDTNGEKYMQC